MVTTKGVAQTATEVEETSVVVMVSSLLYAGTVLVTSARTPSALQDWQSPGDCPQDGYTVYGTPLVFDFP